MLVQVLYFDGGVYYNKMKKFTTWHESLQKVGAFCPLITQFSFEGDRKKLWAGVT